MILYYRSVSLLFYMFNSQRLSVAFRIAASAIEGSDGKEKFVSSIQMYCVDTRGIGRAHTCQSESLCEYTRSHYPFSRVGCFLNG